MATVQLNVRVDAALAAKLKEEAKRRHALPGALVAQALEQFLGSASNASAALAAPSKEWQKPLAALEARVAKLEAKPAPPAAAKAEGRGHKSVTNGHAFKPATDQPLQAQPSTKAAAAPSGALTTAELALLTRTNKGGWNNWARPDRIGKVRSHATAGDWRLVGKAAAKAGGPERWIWERV